MKDLSEFNKLKDLVEDDPIKYEMAEWLEVMVDCSDRVHNHCTLAHRMCEHEMCPGNNTALNGS